jgi:hypothetical protein
MRNLNLNLVVFGAALATALYLIAFFLINVGDGPEAAPDIKTILIGWALCFLLPPFVVALKASKVGALYGLVIGIVPVIFIVLTGNLVPIFMLIIFYMFAPLGGYLGEITSRIMFKP